MWFTEYGADAVGYVDRRGRVTEYRLPTPNASPAGIAFGADRNMWVTESGYGASKIAKVTPAGAITEYRLPTSGAQPFGIAAFGHGLWLTEFGAGKIASGDLSGHFTEYQLRSEAAAPLALTITPGREVWFTEPATGQLGRLSFKRGRENIVEYPLPERAAALDVAPGPHGTVWTTEYLLDSVGVFTP
jgi:virginiamycin B lyase